MSFNVQMEAEIRESMGAAVKHWVHSLSKILVGDKKAEVPPLFSVILTLEKNQRIELKPTVQVPIHPPLSPIHPVISQTSASLLSLLDGYRCPANTQGQRKG
jgi:hypothetical protein